MRKYGGVWQPLFFRKQKRDSQITPYYRYLCSKHWQLDTIGNMDSSVDEDERKYINISLAQIEKFDKEYAFQMKSRNSGSAQSFVCGN